VADCVFAVAKEEAAGGQAQEHQGLGRCFRSGLGPRRSGGEARPRARQHDGQSGVAVANWLAEPSPSVEGRHGRVGELEKVMAKLWRR
jgi:hypothetical protein